MNLSNQNSAADAIHTLRESLGSLEQQLASLYADRERYCKRAAWVDILLNVNHAPQPVLIGSQLITCDAGQCLYSLDTWAKRWQWENKMQVRRFLDLLERMEMIRTENVTKTLRLTVCKWASYQTNGYESVTEPLRNGYASVTHPLPIEEYKETKEEKEGEEAAPQILNSQFSILNSVNPGTAAFDLLRRIGKPAAQIWTQGSAAAQFDTPAHAALALDWMEHLCRKQRPLQSQQELIALVAQFKGKTIAEINAVAQYSYQGGYTALYFDRLNKKNNGNRHNLDPKDLEKSRQTAKTTPSGLKLL